jgi:hypothetical protein
VTEVAPQTPLVEVREGDEEIGERLALVMEQLSETVREIACVHEAIFACVLELS